MHNNTKVQSLLMVVSWRREKYEKNCVERESLSINEGFREI